MDWRNDTPKGGLPHSDIHGSKPARGSPWLFAACHVLHRLLVPRHPPNALIILRSSCQLSGACLQRSLSSKKSVFKEVCLQRSLSSKKSVFKEVCLQRSLSSKKSVFKEVCLQ